MPRADELPVGLKALATRNYIRLTHERFRLDTQVLVKALRHALDEVAAAREDAARREAEELERRRQEEEAARRAQAEREAAEEVAQRAQAEREAEEKARQQKEEARRFGIAGLSAEHLTKAEELANWDFIKQSTDRRGFPRSSCALSRRRVRTHGALQALDAGLVGARLGAQERGARSVSERTSGRPPCRGRQARTGVARAAGGRPGERGIQSGSNRSSTPPSARTASWPWSGFSPPIPTAPRPRRPKSCGTICWNATEPIRTLPPAAIRAKLQAFLDAYPTSAAASEVRRMLSHSRSRNRGSQVAALGQGDARRDRLCSLAGCF